MAAIGTQAISATVRFRSRYREADRIARIAGALSAEQPGGQHGPGAQHQEGHCSHANDHRFNCAQVRHARWPLGAAHSSARRN